MVESPDKLVVTVTIEVGTKAHHLEVAEHETEGIMALVVIVVCLMLLEDQE
jgi:hypothetical protein